MQFIKFFCHFHLIYCYLETELLLNMVTFFDFFFNANFKNVFFCHFVLA